jgi:hypothetical protein
MGGGTGGTCSDNFWDTETSGQASSACAVGNTTANMKKQSTYFKFDFASIWSIDEDVWYPLQQVFIDAFPQITISHPTNTTYSYKSILINFTATDDDAVSAKWYYNTTDNVTYTVANNITLEEGFYAFKFYANDTANQLNTTSLSFSIDLAPTIYLVSPSNNTHFNSSTQNFTCNITDGTAISALKFYVWNSTHDEINTTVTSLSGTSNSTNWTYTLPSYEGQFKWNCKGNDSANNANFSTDGNFIFTLYVINQTKRTTYFYSHVFDYYSSTFGIALMFIGLGILLIHSLTNIRKDMDREEPEKEEEE